MTKNEMVTAILSNLTPNINRPSNIKWVSEKNSKNRISEVFEYYIKSNKTKEDSYFCYNLLVLPNL